MGKVKWYLWHLENMEDFCETFKRKIIETDFIDSKTKKILSDPLFYTYCWTPLYQGYWKTLSDIVNICDMLGITHLELNKSVMAQRIEWLDTPELLSKRSYFESYTDLIKEVFKKVEKELREKLQLLEEEEKYRLNEALNCYINECNYSAVAISVSAIEFRLLNLMQLVKPNSKLEKYTLGELINEYLQNKKAYKNVIPKKHEPLLNLCNVYRIFSVHPKKEKITRAIATSIINMTFAFLLDKKMKQKAEVK